jgi:hypothetical protein
MLVEEDNYEHFNNETINELSKLKFKFNLYDRFISVKDENGIFFKAQTPFLKVLKPIHNTFNKKKTIAKKYIILETNDELDFNNQVGQFMFIINKIHEISQEKIRENSIEWFNTEFDDIGLDIKVKRPIDQQKDSEFIKICIPDHLVEEVEQLSKGNYLLCNILFKGLKVSSDYIMEEWELDSFLTQEKYEELNNDLHEDLKEDFHHVVELDEIFQEDELKNNNQGNIENSDNKEKEIIFETKCDDLREVLNNENTLKNTLKNTLENTLKNTLENTLENKVGHTFENTIDHIVDPTVEDTVDYNKDNSDIKLINLKSSLTSSKKNNSNINDNKLKKRKTLKKNKELIKKTPKKLLFNK